MARKLVVEIIGDSSNMSRAFKDATGSANSFGSTLNHVAKIALVAAGAAGIAGLAITLKMGAEEWKQHALVAAQTAAVLKSTGESANITAAAVDALATSMMKKSGVDDEAIQTGENMLLTFTNIRNEAGKGNDIFNQTTSVLLDMTTALTHGNVSAEALGKQAIQLGKAINDPVKGMSALQRVGVTFTEDQKKTVEAMVKTGDVMGAQKLILAELNKEFGGSAEAMGKTLPGQINILKEMFSNLAGEIFERLVPALATVVEWVNLHWPEISATFNQVFDVIGKVITETVSVGKTLLDFYEEHKTLVLAVGAAIAAAAVAIETITLATKAWAAAQLILNTVMEANPIGIVIIALAALAAGLVVAYQRSETFRNIVNNAFEDVRNVVATVVNTATALWDRWGDKVKQVADLIKTLLTGLVNTIRSEVQLISDILHGRWGEIWDDVKAVVTNALGMVEAAIRLWAATIGTAAKALGVAIIHGIQTGLENLAGYVYEKLLEIPTALKTAAMAVAGFALQLGLDVVSGIINGLGGLADALASKLIGSFSDAWRRLKSWLGISSASKKARDEIGVEVGAGVIEGILLGLIDMPAKMNEKLKAALEAARVTIQAEQSRLTEAFDRLGQLSIQAFEGATSAALDKMQTTFDAHIKRAVTDPMQRHLDHLADLNDQALAKIRASGEAQTDAEKTLSAMQLAHQKAANAERLAEDRAALAAAMALQIEDGETQVAFEARKGAAIKAANDAVNEDLYQAQLADQEKKAAASRTAADNKMTALEKRQAAEYASEQTATKNVFAVVEKGLTDTYNVNILNYKSLRDLQEGHLGQMLATLGTELEKHPGKWKEIHAKVMALFADSFGPDFKTAAKNLGTSFGKGVEEAEGDVSASAGKISAAVNKQLRYDGMADEYKSAGRSLSSSFAQGVSDGEEEAWMAAQKVSSAVAKQLRLGSPSKEGPMSTLDKWWTPFAGTLLGGLDAGRIRSAVSGVVKAPAIGGFGVAGGAARSGETIINLTVHGFVGDEQALTDRVLSALRRETTRTPSLGLT